MDRLQDSIKFCIMLGLTSSTVDEIVNSIHTLFLFGGN